MNLGRIRGFRRLLLGLMPLAFLFVFIPSAFPLEHYAMDRLLELIPPDGPPEHYGNVVLRTTEGERHLPSAIFPHWLHRIRYTCTACHRDIGFSLVRGETPITRQKNLAGYYCGTCHNGETAFTVVDLPPRQCHRCHRREVAALDAEFRRFSSFLPGGSSGNGIDWTRALEEELINPQEILDSASHAIDLPKNLQRPLLLRGSSSASETFFPHRQHLPWVDCSMCHPEIFNIQKKGTALFSMETNLYGWFCGACHLRVSFSMLNCRQCHPKMTRDYSAVRRK